MNLSDKVILFGAEYELEYWKSSFRNYDLNDL